MGFEEEVKERVWKDVMAEEYESIMKNDMWDMVLIPQGKSVVTSYTPRKVCCGF